MGFDWEGMFGDSCDIGDAWASACMATMDYDNDYYYEPRKPRYYKETWCGIWKNKNVQFNRKWGTKHFTDYECKRLCTGNKIAFIYPCKDSINRIIIGQLQQRKYKNTDFVGFEKDMNIHIPLTWNHHTFTEKELQDLMEGNSISIDDAISRKGNPFTCTLSFDFEQNKLQPTF